MGSSAKLLRNQGATVPWLGTRASLVKGTKYPMMVRSEHLGPRRYHDRLHISVRQFARIIRGWISSIGSEVTAYGTPSIPRTKITKIYNKTDNLRAVQLLLRPTKMDGTERPLGVEPEEM